MPVLPTLNVPSRTKRTVAMASIRPAGSSGKGFQRRRADGFGMRAETLQPGSSGIASEGLGSAGAGGAPAFTAEMPPAGRLSSGGGDGAWDAQAAWVRLSHFGLSPGQRPRPRPEPEPELRAVSPNPRAPPPGPARSRRKPRGCVWFSALSASPHVPAAPARGPGRGVRRQARACPCAPHPARDGLSARRPVRGARSARAARGAPGPRAAHGPPRTSRLRARSPKFCPAPSLWAPRW
jgi:hypothetical protein